MEQLVANHEQTPTSFFGRHRKPKKNRSSREFTPWDCLKACSFFHQDFGCIPEEFRHHPAYQSPMDAVQQELYTDLLEARAEGRLDELLVEFRDFIEEGV